MTINKKELGLENEDKEIDLAKLSKELSATIYCFFEMQKSKSLVKGTFDSSNPNIYHANATLGGGVLGGSIAGLEYDKNGNIKGFSPEKFLAGFIAGGITSKATQAALKSPKLRQKALDFSDKAGEIISRTLKESNLPKHAQNALEIALGKRLANALDSRAWINEPKEAIKSLEKDTRELATMSNQNPKNDKITRGVDSLDIMSNQKLKGKDMDLSEFIKNDELDYNQMGKIATLPPMQKYKDFMGSFLDGEGIKKLSKNKVAMQTPAGEVKIYLPYAYGHFHKNGKFGNKKEQRNNLTGALKEILKNPLFVTKDKQGALYFYKPFRDENNILDLISVSVDKEGKIQYKTTYADKYKQVLDLIKNNELVYRQELA